MTDPNAIGYDTLGADINKLKGGETQENKLGVVSPLQPELTLDMKDEDIVKLTKAWKKQWDESTVKSEWEKKCKENEDYWLGKQFDNAKGDKTRPNVDNLIFESVETYLPQVTRRNPDPIVTLDNGVEQTDASGAYVIKLKDKLGTLADKNKLRLKLKRTARNWCLYYVGVLKYGWDLDHDMPIVRVIRPKKIILDPEAWIDEDGYTGSRVGEIRKMEAKKLLSIMGEPKGPDEAGVADPNAANLTEARKEVTELVKNDLGTDVQFIEWWTQEYMCWTLNDKVLLKRKNPHWNYDGTVAQVTVDDYGNETTAQNEQKGINHFSTPQIPYSFFVVFNLGDQPMDKTNLIEQNLANQDRLNKRNKQIDRNADNMNEGLVVSLERSGLTDAQAKNVSAALRKGGVIAIPTGAASEAVYKPPVTGLPADVFNDRNDIRERTRDIFGIRGSTAGGIQTEATVRGKILSRGLDTDRIGGGVSEYLEQLADDVYNWMAQLLYVYDPDYQFINGKVPPKVVISVKEGSLLPKDSTTIANQAIELASAGKMSNLDLYKRLEYPNAEEIAANAWLEVNAPEVLYSKDPRIAQVMAARQQPVEEKGPSMSINYKDVTPSAKSQMLAKAGIEDAPEAILGDETAKTEIAAAHKAKPTEKSLLGEVSPTDAGA